MLSVLRHALWLPLFLLFATPVPFTLGIAAVAFCACYHYLASVSLLGLRGHEARMYVTREAVLHGFFLSLMSQIWWRGWNWFEFAALYQPAKGVGVFVTLVALLAFINWIFHFDFELNAARQRIILNKSTRTPAWLPFSAFMSFTILLLFIWQAVGWLGFSFWSSPDGVIEAASSLFATHEIYRDIGASLSEIAGGLCLGLVIACCLVALASATHGKLKATLLGVFSLLYIAPIALWLFTWVIPPLVRAVGDFPGLWHKVIAVAFLSLYTLTQTLWALRDDPPIYRVLSAVNDALPIAFVAMLFGELFAATAGLGFMMTVASATYQMDKGLAGFMIVTTLLAVISATLTWITKRLDFTDSSKNR
jgi:NitT/TauT family transport system permease protein